MAHPKLRNIVRWHRLGKTVREIAWLVDEEPAVVREALDYHKDRPQRKRRQEQSRDRDKTEAVETVRMLLTAGYSLDVVRANFCDLVPEEELRG